MNDTTQRSHLRALVALVTCPALLPLAACDAVTSKRTTEQIVPVEPGTAVHVSTQNGWIKVRPGRDGFVSLRAHSRVTALRDGEKRLEQLTVRVSKERGTLHIRGRHPKDPGQRRFQLSLVVTVPRKSRVSLESDRGYLEVANLSGDVRGRTGEGEIRIQDVTGALDLRTGAGNIRATGAFESLSLETQLGEILVNLTPGSRLSADCTLLSRRGAVSLSLPPDVPATVTAESRSGSVSSEAPTQSKRPGWLRALVAGGGPLVSLVSHRGSVRLRLGRR